MKIQLRRFFTPKSLRFQLLSRSLLFMAVLLVLIGFFQYLFMRQFIYENKAASIQSQIMSVQPDTWEQLVNNIPVYGPNRFPFFFMPDSTLAYIDHEGNVLIISNGPLKNGLPPQLDASNYQDAMRAKHQLTYKIVNSANGDEQLVVLQPIESRGHLPGVVQVSVATKPLTEVLFRQLMIFLSLALLALIGGILAFIPVLKKTLVPLSNMVDTVEQIDAGNLSERFPVDQGQMEIDRLAVSFNGMLERLESSFEAEKEAKERMRRFVADASHELRTPLTAIHGFLEVLLRGAMNQPDKLHKSLKGMFAESERMKKLVQDLLLLAKLDRSPNIQLSEGELNDVILQMEPQLKLLAGNRHVNLRLAAPAKCQFDEDKMKQILLNLFQNAVQHTDPEKGQIELSLETVDDVVVLAVKDNGLGIPAEHLPHLFDRFYRIDSSRTRKYGGAGLGLSITQSIVELHGGTIQVESHEGEGSVFYVRLPKT